MTFIDKILGPEVSVLQENEIYSILIDGYSYVVKVEALYPKDIDNVYGLYMDTVSDHVPIYLTFMCNFNEIDKVHKIDINKAAILYTKTKNELLGTLLFLHFKSPLVRDIKFAKEIKELLLENRHKVLHSLAVGRFYHAKLQSLRRPKSFRINC